LRLNPKEAVITNPLIKVPSTGPHIPEKKAEEVKATHSAQVQQAEHQTSSKRLPYRDTDRQTVLKLKEQQVA